MWDNPRLLNLAAGALVGIAVFVFAVAGMVLLVRSPFFPVARIELAHPLGNTTREEIAAAARGRITGNFFAVAPAQVRAALEALPWVRRASVRRLWPDRLEVSLDEHVPLARWGDEGLVDIHGERFAATTDTPLPLFVGPEGSEHVMTQRYLRLSQLLAPLGAKVARLVLTPRYAWHVTLDNGLRIMLGRDPDGAEARLARFVEVYPETLGRIPRAHEYVDLRYGNGFALRVAELEG